MSRPKTEFQLAEQGDLEDVMLGLAALARDLGDPFHATQDTVRDTLFGPERFAYAILAKEGVDLTGLVFCSPSLSTVQGQTALYVSDLWVARHTRGQALGRQLLCAAMAEARKRWNAGSLRLLVYAQNEPAMGFYKHLGFDIRDEDKTAVLNGSALVQLMGDTT